MIINNNDNSTIMRIHCASLLLVSSEFVNNYRSSPKLWGRPSVKGQMLGQSARLARKLLRNSSTNSRFLSAAILWVNPFMTVYVVKKTCWCLFYI